MHVEVEEMSSLTFRIQEDQKQQQRQYNYQKK